MEPLVIMGVITFIAITISVGEEEKNEFKDKRKME